MNSNINGDQTNVEGNFYTNPTDNIPMLSSQIHLLQQLQIQDKAINSANRNPFMKFIDYSNPVVVGGESQQPINLTTNTDTNIEKCPNNEVLDEPIYKEYENDSETANSDDRENGTSNNEVYEDLSSESSSHDSKLNLSLNNNVFSRQSIKENNSEQDINKHPTYLKFTGKPLEQEPSHEYKALHRGRENEKDKYSCPPVTSNSESFSLYKVGCQNSSNLGKPHESNPFNEMVAGSQSKKAFYSSQISKLAEQRMNTSSLDDLCDRNSTFNSEPTSVDGPPPYLLETESQTSGDSNVGDLTSNLRPTTFKTKDANSLSLTSCSYSGFIQEEGTQDQK